MTARILKGPVAHVPNITKGLGEAFFETAEKYSERIFQIDAHSEQTETWAQVKQRSVRLAIYLKSIGTKPKDVVMLGQTNNMDNIVPALAAIFLGASVSSFDPSQDVSDIKYTISYIEPSVIVVDADVIDTLEKALNDANTRQTIIVAGSNETHFKPHPSDLGDTAFIFFSSGTTSLPKGICLTHKTLLGTGILPNWSPDITMFQNSSLHWISGGLFVAIQINSGCKKIIGPNISAKRVLYLIEKYEVITYLITSAHVCDLINMGEEIISKFDVSSLKLLILIGSAFSPIQIRSLRKLFPHTKVFSAYGATEIGGGITTFMYPNIPSSAWDDKIASAGKIIQNVEVKFVDPESRELLPPNKEGEILVKTSRGMSGYYKAENLDAYDAEGFLKTGDLGYYDEEEFIYVTDRLNSTFKYKTYKVSPILIETLLKEHPAVQDAVVIGIPHERDRNLPAACVVLKSTSSASPQELQEFSDSRVSSDFCKLRGGLKIVPSFPLTPSGKIQRKKVKELFLNT